MDQETENLQNSEGRNDALNRDCRTSGDRLTIDQCDPDRQIVLKSLGASGDVLKSLLEYCENPFTIPAGVGKMRLEDEPHVTDWEKSGIPRKDFAPCGFRIIAGFYPQLEIPVRVGISSTREYGEVARKGEVFESVKFGGQFEPVDPDGISLSIVTHPAGALPLVEVSCREDFENLLRGLTLRSEPVPVNPSVYAQMISGIINWKRVHSYKESWLTSGGDPSGWTAEMKRMAADEPSRFRDRLILICRGPYSGVSPEVVGLGTDMKGWIKTSRDLRIEHELTHYSTKRLFGAMRNNLLDEIIADYMGCVSALENYRADWQMAFWGISGDKARPGSRIHAYRRNLDDEAFSILCLLANKAAEGLEEMHPGLSKGMVRLEILGKLASMTLETMASAVI